MYFSQVTYDAACLILRLALAVVFVAHGWQKIYVWTLDGTAERFAEMNVPAADVAAPGLAILEIVGGALIGFGLATRLLAAALGAAMVGAIVFVHAGNGPFVADNGFELALVLAAGCAVLVLLGPGSVRADLLFPQKEDDEWADDYR